MQFLALDRPWWSNDVPDDGNLHQNLSKHFECAKQGVERSALLLDARWTILRSRIGGILDLKADYEQLDDFVLQLERRRESDSHIEEARRSFNNMFMAVRLSWGRMGTG